LSKVLGEEDQLFRRWILELQQHRPIHPFRDMVLAPIPILTVVSLIQSIAERRMDGIMQLSGNYDISYSEAATLGVKSLGFDENLIKPISAAEAGFLPEQLPRNTTLDMQRLRKIFGIEPPDVRDTIKQNFNNIFASLKVKIQS